LNRRSKGGTKLPKEITVIGSVAGLVGLAALLHVVHAGPTLTFICCALALAGVAYVIGEAFLPRPWSWIYLGSWSRPPTGGVHPLYVVNCDYLPLFTQR